MIGENRCENANLLAMSASESLSDSAELIFSRKKLKTKKKLRAGISRLRRSPACTALCLFKVLAIFVATAGLGFSVWLLVTLQLQVYTVKEQLAKMEEGSRGTPGQFHDLHTDMKQLVGNNTALHADMAKLNLTLMAITKGVDDILKRVGQLEQKAGNHTELGRLPDEVKQITDAVASVGSKLLDLDTSVAKLKSETSDNQNLKSSLDTLEEDVKSVKLSQANSLTRDQLNQGLLNAFSGKNSTLGAKFHSTLEELVDKNTRIAEIQSLIQNLSLRINVLESSSLDQQSIVLNQVTVEKLNEIVQSRLNATLSKMVTDSSVWPIAMMTSNGTVNMREMSNYVKNLTNLYVALISKLQKGQETQALNTSVNLDLSANVEDLVNGLLSADRQQFKKIQSDFGVLQVSFESLKTTTDNNMKKLAEIEEAVGKLSSGNLQTPPVSPNIATSSSSQPNNNSSTTTTVATTETQNQIPPKKPTLTGASLNVEPENKPNPVS